MDTSVAVSTTALSDDNDVTIVQARATITFGDEVVLYDATGSSRRHPEDHPDDEIAICLATSRALKTLGRRIARDAQDRVRTKARQAEKQREASERAARLKAERAKEIRAKVKKSKKKTKKKKYSR